jgi:hypothetical protein
VPLDFRVPSRGRGGLVLSPSPCTEDDDEVELEWIGESEAVGRKTGLATSGSVTAAMLASVCDAMLKDFQERAPR